jgi:hypothetical protein
MIDGAARGLADGYTRSDGRPCASRTRRRRSWNPALQRRAPVSRGIQALTLAWMGIFARPSRQAGAVRTYPIHVPPMGAPVAGQFECPQRVDSGHSATLLGALPVMLPGILPQGNFDVLRWLYGAALDRDDHQGNRGWLGDAVTLLFAFRKPSLRAILC